MQEIEKELEEENTNNTNNIINFDKEKILVNKSNYIFKRLKRNYYQSIAILENKNMSIEKIIGFPFIKLMFEINNDCFEIVDMDILNEDEANLFVLMKPLFSHLGFSQRYLGIKLKKQMLANKGLNITAELYPELLAKYNIKNKNIISAPIVDLQILIQIISPYKFQMIEFIKLEDNFLMSSFFEKIFSSLYKRIFMNIINVFSTFV